MTSSMAFQGASSSSSFTGPWKYDVVLSFGGDDTRSNFIAHLHRALLQNGITTFIDDDELKRGEEISPALYQAIEQSRISIVVFSQNYVSSRWCLNELLKIRECKETNGQIVLPVFYKVDPSDLRHQKNSFEQALATHEERFKDDIKVENWKAALTQVANLSGFDLEHYRNEAQFIDKIVQHVSRILNHTYFHVAKHSVGIESRVREINSLLSIDQMNDIRMVGILGAAGIGKTTIAKSIYNLMAYEFEGSCFLVVGENSKQKLDLVKLQNTLLSKILGQTVKVDSVDEGITLIKKRLCSKRVFLILDDVDKLDQLDKLAGNVDWFGLGSRIIIITRDRKVLTNHGVVDDLIYKVKELDWNEALELFCWNAFKGDKPIDEFLKLAKDAIRYIGGLPLALDVLGSHLYGEDIHTWRSELEKFKRIPHGKFQERLGILGISYDGLHEVPQVHLSSCPSPSLGQEPNQSSLPPGNGEQGSNSSISSQGVILVLIGSVIGLLQLNDLFETHPANMWISEAALIIFCMSYATMTKINGTRWARHSQIIDRFRILSGTLVAVSLLSIHLPHQLSWLFYVIWAFLVFIVACTWIYPEGEGREVETSISLVPV